MKRLFDAVVSSVALLLLALPMLVLAGLVWAKLGSPVLYSQVRPGRNGLQFVMLKFRTMTNATDDKGQLLLDSARLTSLGRWLRVTSLDELPELWNVLRGDMSLVGPRPLLMEYLPLYNERQRRRHEVRPGITGWAQVNGRNSLSWEEKFELDVWYVDNRSLLLDIRIILMTLVKVLKREGVTARDGGITPKFEGDGNINQSRIRR